MKVIFLDVDGVLIHKNYQNKENKHIDETKIELLKKIINETQAKIVLSSSWRSIYENNGEKIRPEYYYVLQKILKKYEIEIYSQTPQLKLKSYKNIYKKKIEFIPETTRAGEINLWLKDNKVETFAIIDDEKSAWSYFGYEQNVIETNYEVGLLEENVLKAIEILNDNEKIKTKIRKIK